MLYRISLALSLSVLAKSMHINRSLNCTVIKLLGTFKEKICYKFSQNFLRLHIIWLTQIKHLKYINKFSVMFVLHSLRPQHKAFVFCTLWLTLKIGHNMPLILDVVNAVSWVKIGALMLWNRHSSFLVTFNFTHSNNAEMKEWRWKMHQMRQRRRWEDSLKLFLRGQEDSLKPFLRGQADDVNCIQLVNKCFDIMNTLAKPPMHEFSCFISHSVS
jgi:hypothetical protein